MFHLYTPIGPYKSVYVEWYQVNTVSGRYPVLLYVKTRQQPTGDKRSFGTEGASCQSLSENQRTVVVFILQ